MKSSTATLTASILFVTGSIVNCLAFAPPAFLAQGPPQIVARQPVSGLTAEQLEFLSHVSIVYLDDGLGGTNKTLRFSDANVQIVNGLGATNGNPANWQSMDSADTATNGLGNLIVGYSEAVSTEQRDGSHNIIAGQGGTWTSFGGVLAGVSCETTGPFATVTGGYENRATARLSAVSGGSWNSAEQNSAWVGGG